MQWLASVCVKRPVFTWVLMLVILVFGGVSYASLGLDKYPKVDLPMVVITTTLQGAAPEEVETEISDKIEAAVNTISGIDELRSTSSEGVSTVTVSFTLEKNADVGAQEVRDHIDNALPTLPKGIDPPVVSRVDPDAAPVLYATLRGPGDIRDLTELADKQVRRRIESISGVGQVTVIGGVKRVIKILVDPIALRSFDLTAADVRQAITNQNFAIPGGTIDRGPRQLTLRIEGKVANLDELRRLVVKNDVGHSIRLEDVAKVEDGAEDETSWASEDGDRVVTLSIRKQSGVNTVAVVDEVKSRLAEIQNSLPTGTKLLVVRDNSLTIRTSVDAVLEHLVLGAVLAAVVVLAFLGSARSTIIAALAIPISVVGSFVLMYLLDFTLNMMTLLALALAVGIVIDDAIVVLENIHRFITHKKLAPVDAAIAATNDIGLAVIATTLSLLAVFLPVAFMSGIVGRFLRSFGLTMVSAIAVSLVVSFTLTPMLCARWLEAVDEDARRAGEKPLLERVVDIVYMPIERVYMAVLRWAMAHRWVIVVASAATLGSCVPLAKAVPISFTAEDDTAQFSVEVRTPEGTSLQATRLVADGVARELRAMTGVEKTLMTIGDNAQSTPNLASVFVKLTEPSTRAESQEVLMARARREVLAHQPKEILTSVGQISDFGGTSAAVGYTLAGPDLDKLADVAKRVTDKLEKVPGAVDVRSSLILGKPEVRLAIDRARAADLGVTPADVANTLQLLVGGLKVSTYTERGEDYDIKVRALPEYRTEARGLLMTVPSRTAKSVPLDSVVRTTTGNGPSKIERLNRRRQIGISCNVAPGIGQSTILQALERIVAEERLPSGYQALAAGSSRETGKAGKAFLLAFAASFVFMYLVLAAQFESWIHPVTILVCLPLTVPFALLSLLLLHQQLTIMSALGLLVLFGVVKKNSILQVDHTNHLRGEGMLREEAILEANRDRLRPILMTTVAFVAGMLPLLFSHGVGSGINHNIAGVIVGGQALSLVLTLLATPVFYSVFDDIEVRWRKFRGHPRKSAMPLEVSSEVSLRESA